MNRLYVCEDISNTSKCPDVPGKLLIRLYGGKLWKFEDSFRTLTEASEVLLFHHLGQLGLGPKLLGVFKGGRLEEFISSHTLSDVDMASSRIREEFGRKLARVHQVKLPIVRQPVDQILQAQLKYDHFLEHGQEKFAKVDLSEFGVQELGMLSTNLKWYDALSLMIVTIVFDSQPPSTLTPHLHGFANLSQKLTVVVYCR